MGLRRLWKRKAQYSGMRRCTQFRAYLMTLERNGVVTGLCYFRGVIELRTPTLLWILGTASGELQRTRRGHSQQIPEVAIPTHSAHVGEAEALDSRVLIGVARSI